MKVKTLRDDRFLLKDDDVDQIVALNKSAIAKVQNVIRNLPDLELQAFLLEADTDSSGLFLDLVDRAAMEEAENRGWVDETEDDEIDGNES